MATQPISVTIEKKIAGKLEELSNQTHRKKSYFVNEALRAYFEEIRDYDIALSRRGRKTTPIIDAKKKLGI